MKHTGDHNKLTFCDSHSFSSFINTIFKGMRVNFTRSRFSQYRFAGSECGCRSPEQHLSGRRRHAATGSGQPNRPTTVPAVGAERSIRHGEVCWRWRTPLNPRCVRCYLLYSSCCRCACLQIVFHGTPQYQCQCADNGGTTVCVAPLI